MTTQRSLFQQALDADPLSLDPAGMFTAAELDALCPPFTPEELSADDQGVVR